MAYRRVSLSQSLMVLLTLLNHAKLGQMLTWTITGALVRWSLKILALSQHYWHQMDYSWILQQPRLVCRFILVQRCQSWKPPIVKLTKSNLTLELLWRPRGGQTHQTSRDFQTYLSNETRPIARSHSIPLRKIEPKKHTKTTCASFWGQRLLLIISGKPTDLWWNWYIRKGVNQWRNSNKNQLRFNNLLRPNNHHNGRSSLTTSDCSGQRHCDSFIRFWWFQHMTSPLSSIRNLGPLMKKVVLKSGSLRRKNGVSLARMKRIAARYKLAPNLTLLGTTSWSWPFKVGHGTIAKTMKRKKCELSLVSSKQTP